jgi:hypothetical protein
MCASKRGFVDVTTTTECGRVRIRRRRVVERGFFVGSVGDSIGDSAELEPELDLVHGRKRVVLRGSRAGC